MSKKDLWNHPKGDEHPFPAEVYRSTVNNGPRGDSKNQTAVVYKVRWAALGLMFGSRADAHAELLRRGFTKIA